MSAATLSRFESALKELDATVSRVERDEFRTHVKEVVRPHAVGVNLTETFDDPSLSLDGTSIEIDPAPATLKEAKTGVTGATLGIADYGSVVLTATDRASELVSLFVERHVAVIRAEDVEEDMESTVDALGTQFRETGESAIIATGPSSTADMGALVKGAHGPREVHVVIVEGE